MKSITIDGKLFVSVCSTDELIPEKGKKIIFDDDIDMEVSIFKIDNEYYCVSNICPHKHQPVIYQGIIKDCTVTCPAHGWTYDLKTGENTNKHQGIKQLKKYQIFEKDGDIYIEKPELEIPKWRQ